MEENTGFSGAHQEVRGRQRSAPAIESDRDENQSHLYPHLRKRRLHHDKDDSLKSTISGKAKGIRSQANSALSEAFQCGICSQKFCSVELLSTHMEDHCKRDIFQCNMCNDIFSSSESLSDHLELHTNVVKTFKCGICSAGFLENEALINHLKQKHEDLPFLYKCNICHCLFKEVSKLISHATIKHPPVHKDYRCGICDKKFTQEARLTLHIQQKHSQEGFSLPSPSLRNSQLPPRALKIGPEVKVNCTTGNENEVRKTRNNKRHHQTPMSAKETKRRSARNARKNDSNEEKTIPGSGEGRNNDHDIDNEEDGDDATPLKSVKRGRKRSAWKINLPGDKKPVITNDKQLLAAYRRIDPQTQTEVFDCDVCGERFYRKSELFTRHRAGHFFNGKFCVHCQHCRQVFDNFEDLEEHVGDLKCKGYTCSKCGKCFPLEPLLLTHQVKDHILHNKNNSKMICSICEKVFDNRTAFLRHASSHSEIKCIQCKLCGHSFTTPETLFGHLRTTHSLIPMTRKKYEFKCNLCGIYFMKMEALQKHESLVHKIKMAPEEDSKPTLTELRKTKPKEKRNSDSQVKRTGHWRSAEDDKSRRTCHICNRVFRRFKDVRRHIGTHTKPYLCSHCGKAFPYRYSLDAHIKAFHSAENPFRCEICSKFFSCPRSLIVHQRIHTGERPHQCHICDKRFRQVANLSMHIKLHNAEKPIKCPLCDYRCRHKGYLKRHMSTHSKEKKHFCPICNKGFTEKPNLNHHLKRHSKIKNHVCAVCGHRFAERYYLNNHMRIHTKEKPYVCPVCDRAFTMRPNMVSHIKKTHPSYNYQPIRPSHQSTAIVDNDLVDNSSMQLEPCLPTISQSNDTSTSGVASAPPPTPTIPLPTRGPSLPTPQIQSLPAPPPLPLPSLTQLAPSIQSYSSDTQLSKLDIHSFQQRDSIIQSQMFKDQPLQPSLVREPQLLPSTDPMMVRSQVILREPVQVQDQVIHLEDPDKRHYVNYSSNRIPETAGFDPAREVPNQAFSVVMPGQDFMYAYPNMSSDPFIQGFFPLPTQHGQHPQQKQ